MCVCVCVCERERERESVCVCKCVIENKMMYHLSKKKKMTQYYFG